MKARLRIALWLGDHLPFERVPAWTNNTLARWMWRQPGFDGRLGAGADVSTHRDGERHYGAGHRRSKWGWCSYCDAALRKFSPTGLCVTCYRSGKPTIEDNRAALARARAVPADPQREEA